MKRFTALFAASALAIMTGISPVLALHRGNATAVIPPPPSTFEVPAGCTAVGTIGGTIYYISPTGSDSNNGLTSGTPFQTFSHAKAVMSNSGGQTLLMLSGNYGDVVWNAKQLSAFSIIKAAPGQTPVFSTLNLLGSTKIIFQSIKFRALANAFDPMIYISGDGTNGVGSDIIFDTNNIASQDDTSLWTTTDWQNFGRWIALETDGKDTASSKLNCVSLTNNTITNVRVGIVAENDHILVKGNILDNNADDAVDFGGQHIEISFNNITNQLYIDDDNHGDGIQGQTANCPINNGGTNHTTCLYDDILINANVLKQQTRTCPLCGDMQGISSFDLDWSNYRVTNNTVITQTNHGISVYACHTCTIANNTVLNTNPTQGTWIGIFGKAHQDLSLPSDHVDMYNNIMYSMDVDPACSGCTETIGTMNVHDNLVQNRITWELVGGSYQFITTEGVYGTRNRLYFATTSVFATFNTGTFSYDLHLQPGPNFAVGTGVLPAPNFSDGTPRVNPVNLGNY